MTPAQWTVVALLCLMGVGAIYAVERVTGAKQDVARMQDSIASIQGERVADSLRAASLRQAVLHWQDSASRAVETAREASARSDTVVDSLVVLRDTAIAAAEQADSIFRAVADSLRDRIRPGLSDQLDRLIVAHRTVVARGREALQASRETLSSRERVIASQRKAVRVLQIQRDTLEAAYLAEQRINASLREELRLTRQQRDRLSDALNTSILGDIFRSPVSHAAMAGIGFAGGLAAR